jgi:hypothetical protein
VKGRLKRISAGELFFCGLDDGNRRVSVLRKAMTEGHGSQTEDNREGDVRQSSPKCTAAREVEGLEAEGREGGKPPQIPTMTKSRMFSEA